MRWILVLLVAVAGCATPTTEDVSREGPTTTKVEKPAEETATTVPVGPIEVGRWVGSEDTDTTNITVEDSWELHWVISGGAGVSVSWYVPGEEWPTDNLSLEVGEGSSLVRKGGTFYLEISSFGASYEIWAVDVPN